MKIEKDLYLVMFKINTNTSKDWWSLKNTFSNLSSAKRSLSQIKSLYKHANRNIEYKIVRININSGETISDEIVEV